MSLFIIISLLSLGLSSAYLTRTVSTKVLRFQAQQTSKKSERAKSPTKLLELVDFKRSKVTSDVPLLEDPILPMVHSAAIAADTRKATSIAAMRVCHLTEITTFMIIIEGNSRPQNQAIASAVEETILLEHSKKPYNKDGNAASGWIILDYGSLIVHIMTPQTKNFYKLERRWKDAEVYDLTNILPNNSLAGEQKTANPDAEKGQEDDPFWN